MSKSGKVKYEKGKKVMRWMKKRKKIATKKRD